MGQFVNWFINIVCSAWFWIILSVEQALTAVRTGPHVECALVAGIYKLGGHKESITKFFTKLPKI